MFDLLNYTHNHNWLSDVKQYEESKKTLAWGVTQKPAKITNKDIQEKDGWYNPILQKYSNQVYEDYTLAKEKTKLIDTIAKNKDSALRIEQTFDVISLQDKLRGLENKADYPIIKSDADRKKKLETSKMNYNILSNITLDKQNFMKPEERPVIDHNPIKGKLQTIAVKTYRDYDLISGKYKERDDEKKEVEAQINRYNSAKLYNKRNVYNPIRAKFYDEQKEAEYKDKMEKIGQNWKINSRRKLVGEGDLYNPINMSIVNDQALKTADKKAKDKKKRFEMRYEMENHYRNSDVEKNIKKDVNVNKKLSYMAYKEIDDRGFSIINTDYKNNNKDYKTQINFRDKKSHWEILSEFAGDDNTLRSKTIYKNPYDYSEASNNEKGFLTERKEKLPKLKDDMDFHKTKSSNRSFYAVKPISNTDKNKIDKDSFFKNNKSVLFTKN